MSRFSRLLPLVLLVHLPAASAQNNSVPELQPRPPEQQQQPETPHGSPRQVTIEVQVTDKSGKPVRGLQKQDFTLLDDKQPLDIVSFQAVDHSATASAEPPAELAVEIVLVVDAVNAPFQAVTYQRDEIRKFLLQNGGKLAQPVSIVFFTDSETKIQQDPSRDGNALAAIYDQYQTGLRTINRSQGIYGAGERFDMSLKALRSLAEYESKRPGRKLMIWVSPGWPLLSGPNIELTQKEEVRLFEAIMSTSAALRHADVTLYAIDPLGLGDFGIRTTFYKEFIKGVAYPKDALAGDLGLQVLAVQTGGVVLNTTNDLTASIATCAADAQVYYTISFKAPRPDHADEYHSLAVTVDKPGVAARTRTGYYDEP